MLDAKGRLTNIGSWYLGGAATNYVPTAAGAARDFVSSGMVAILAVVAGLLAL
jgi:hypothetical protein